MSYLVSEFFINPVLRQARRFSSGVTKTTEPDEDIAACCSVSLPPNQRSVVEEEGEIDARREHIPDEPRTMAAAEQVPPPQLEAESAGLATTTTTTTTRHHSDSTTQPAQTTIDAVPVTIPSRNPEASASASAAAAPSSGGSQSLPEDDGMGQLRRRIIAIQARDLPQQEKAVLVHELLMEGYNRSQVRVAVRGVEARLRPESKSMWEQALATSPREGFRFWNHMGGEGMGGGGAGLSLKVSLSEDDLRPTFVPPGDGEGESLEEDWDGEDGMGPARPLGCEHYRRNVKMQCTRCERWYTCRLCHDAVEDHQLPRKETVHMLCMLCGCAQRVGDSCIKCGTAAARYYCGVCKLWNDDPDKSIYHCNDCGICRVGQGLGKDFFHCNKCMACIAASISEKHKCIERSTDRDCPICGDNMFDSVKRVIFMDCGHTIHHSCFKELLKTSYRCPLCNKSVVNMEIQFRNYDAAIQNQPMPDEYRDTRAVVSCNDCSAKSQTAYHWLGLRCSICKSYNTVALQLLDLPTNAVPAPGSEVAALAVGAGAGAVSTSQAMDLLPSPPLAAMAPPTMTAGPSWQGSRQGSRQGSQHLDSWIAGGAGGGPAQPSLPQETSDSSTASAGPTYSPDGGMQISPPPPPLSVPAAALLQAADFSAEDDDEDGDEDVQGDDGDAFWDGDVMGNILSSPGESGSESEDDGDSDEEEDEDEEDEKEDPLMLPGHR